MGDRHHGYQKIEPFIRLENDVGSTDVHYSLFYESIPNEFKEVALKELNETDENRKVGLLKLREFLKSQEITGVDDHILLTVLRTCKYNLKNSEKKLMKYLQMQDTITKWLQTADLKRVEMALIHRFIGLLPYRDKHGKALIYTTPYDIDLELFDMDEAALCALCLFLYALSFPLTTVAGLAYIAECKTPSLSILYPIIKTFRKYMLSILTLPFRLRKIDVINENFIIRWGYNLLRPLLPSKLVQRVKFNGGDIKNLQKFYPSAILPEEFGGTLGPINPQLYAKDFLNFTRKLKSRNIFLQN